MSNRQPTSPAQAPNPPASSVFMDLDEQQAAAPQGPPQLFPTQQPTSFPPQIQGPPQGLFPMQQPMSFPPPVQGPLPKPGFTSQPLPDLWQPQAPPQPFVVQQPASYHPMQQPQQYMNAYPMPSSMFANAYPPPPYGYPPPSYGYPPPPYAAFAMSKPGDGFGFANPQSLKSVGIPFSRDSNYQDDQPAEPKSVSASPAASLSREDKLELSAKPALSPLQGLQEVPCMISLKGVSKDLDEIERARPSLDLVCVIDISGSMEGAKVELVRQTIGFLVTKLTKHDRLSIVIFDNDAFRVCRLIPCDETNRPLLEDYASRFTAEGGTNMLAGLECGLKVLACRRTINTVTSLFFLSDGVDNNRDTALARSQATLTQYRSLIKGEFTVHTFGYGSDHDSNIMCNIADQGLGAFHYVEKFESIAEAFADSFGGLVSQVARSVEVRLELIPAPLQCRITKMYTKGDEEVYKLAAIMANESKDLVFLLEVAGATATDPVTFPAVRAHVKYLSVDGAQVTETVDLTVSVLPPGAEVQLNAHEDVLVNFYRVKGAEILKQASRLAETREFQQAQTCLQRGISEFRGSLVASHTLVAVLIKDLEDAVERVRSEGAWRAGGAAQVQSKCSNHYAQAASSNTAYYAQPQQASYNMQFQAYQQAMPSKRP